LAADGGEDFLNLISSEFSSIMNIVLKQAKHILNLTSGKTVFVECEKIEKVVNFYIENGFHILDNESMSENKKDLIQLYRLL